MNITTADPFTFDKSNTMFLTSQTGTGKTEFVRRTIHKFEDAYTPKEMQYVIFDLKAVEFIGEDNHKPEYLYFSIITDSNYGLEKLEELAAIAEARTTLRYNPILFIYIEECDISCLDQQRFDNAVIKINKSAKQANIKLIYSTSRVASDTISKELLESFDSIATGKLYDDASYAYLGVPKVKNQPPNSFTIVGNEK
jgi:DNA segregation ATPase FtsK/SpoIIIE-like protein